MVNSGDDVGSGWLQDCWVGRGSGLVERSGRRRAARFN
jgi:hypothetical protein